MTSEVLCTVCQLAPTEPPSNNRCHKCRVARSKIRRQATILKKYFRKLDKWRNDG